MSGIRVGVVIAVVLVCNVVFADQLFFKAQTINTDDPTLFGKKINLSSFKSL